MILRSTLTTLLTTTIFLTPTLASPPPKSGRETVVDDYHGVKIEDHYRWLEGSAAIEDGTKDAELDERVSQWMDAQNGYTRSILDNLPGRERLEKRIGELMTIDSIGAPSSAGRFYFNRERYGDQNQSVLYIREGLDGDKRVLIDPNTLHEKGLISLDWTVPNHDGTLLAFGTSLAGDEITTLHLMGTQTGEWLADEIPNRAGGVSWLPDSTGFLYEALREADNPYSTQIKFHKVGTHHRQDPILFEQHSETWGPGAWLSRDGRWMILVYWTSTKANDIWVIDFDRWQRTGEFVRTDIAVGEDANFFGSINGDTLFMRTTLGAPNGAVYAVDLNNPARENWKLIIPERSDAVLEGVSMARGMLVAEYGYKARTQMERFDYEGNSLGLVKLPGLGSAGLITNDDRTEAFLTYTSFNEPPSIYHTDLAGDELALWDRPDIPVDPSLLEVKQVEYSSKDGTPVTMFIVHKKGITLNGDNPTYLTGYGGFNISMNPRFSATMFPWYEAGGVMALPNLRGGGEYGETWHAAGILENKQNVFDDFIGAAQWLIDNEYTNPNRLAIAGGSNGGLLVGAVATQRPDLFRAVICAVPLLDMLRFEKFLMARYWVPEYGSAEDPEQFEFIRAYSPYQNIEEGTDYPAMLITAGENDSRVHALHARKMAAALQDATSADPSDKPIMLWVDREAGHGGGKPLAARIREVVDQRLFVMNQLGVSVP